MNIMAAFAAFLTSPYTPLGLLVLAYFWLWVLPNQKIFLAEDGPDEEANRRRAGDRRVRLAWIRGRTFQRRYLRFLEWSLDWFSQRISKDRDSLEDSRTSDSWLVHWFGVDPFTEGSYLLCLSLAFFYPVAGFFIGWLYSDSGYLFGLEFLPPIAEGWQRLLILGGSVAFGWSLVKSLRADGWYSWLYLAVAFIFAFAGAFAGIGALVGAVFAEWMRKRLHSPGSIATYWLSFNLFSVCYVSVVLLWALPQTAEFASMALLFPASLAILPLTNGALNWISLAITRGLLYAIRSGRRSGLWALAWALLDMVLVLLFLFTIASLITLLLSGINAATVYWVGAPLLDLRLLFDKLALEPLAADLGWLYFMLLSTLIPTLVHFLIAGSSAVLVLLPDRLRYWILKNFNKGNEPRRVAFLYVSLAPLLALAAPLSLLWLLYTLLNAHHSLIGGGLLNWARWIAVVVDPCMT